VGVGGRGVEVGPPGPPPGGVGVEVGGRGVEVGGRGVGVGIEVGSGSHQHAYRLYGPTQCSPEEHPQSAGQLQQFSTRPEGTPRASQTPSPHIARAGPGVEVGIGILVGVGVEVAPSGSGQGQIPPHPYSSQLILESKGHQQLRVRRQRQVSGSSAGGFCGTTLHAQEVQEVQSFGSPPSVHSAEVGCGVGDGSSMHSPIQTPSTQPTGQ